MANAHYTLKSPFMKNAVSIQLIQCGKTFANGAQALQPMARFRQFCDVKDASQQGKGKGQTFTWDVVANVGASGGTLVETSTMPETQFTVTQATLTINEYGNSVPYSRVLKP